MSDFSLDENRNVTPQTAAGERPEELRPEEAAASAAETADIPAAQASAEESAVAAEEPPRAAEETVPEEASWSSEPSDGPTSVLHRTRATAPRASAVPRSHDQVWGVCIGLALGLLCVGCIILLTFFAVSTSRGIKQPLSPSNGSMAQQPVEPDAPDISLQVHEVPRDEDGYTTQYIAEQVLDSVVGILVYDGSGIDAVGGGTGIVMTEDGYIITNAHVVVDSVGLTVVMNDETRYSARVVGYDEKSDLAVVKVNAEGLKPAEFGDSDAVVVGERAIAIGNPSGLAGSVSQGIISGLDREITITLSDNTVTTLTTIQTDAAINPGNSGGPLLNAWGQVIAINSSKIVASAYEGIGFSIPVNDAKPIIDNLIQYGYVKDRAVLGITVIALDSTNGPANGLPSQGLYIASIADYSDMGKHGIVAGDVILKAGGQEMLSTSDLTDMLKKYHPGDTITMEILSVYENRTVTVDVLLLDSKASEG